MRFGSPRIRILIPALAAMVVGGGAFMAFRPPAPSPAPPDQTKPKASVSKPKPEKPWKHVKGLHVTGWIAGGKNSFQKLVDMCNRTELNALCIDVKDSDGVVTFDTSVPLEREIGASRKCIGDVKAVVAKMEENDIYPIARIAVFRDPILAGKKPDMGVQRIGGGLWRDHRGAAWTNPYDKRVWDYNIDIAIECAKLGFKEIQWDYVRFPSDGRVSQCVYAGKGDKKDSQAIMDFLAYAREKLKPHNVVVSADIFGLVSLVRHDMGIGQTIQMIAKHVDYICPMVYPSHYANGEYGIPNPNKAPYKTVLLSMGDAVRDVKGTKCKIRPWLQDFSLYGVHYGVPEINAQRKACKEVGVTEFLLWNPRCRYTEAALAPEKNADGKTAEAQR